MSDLEFKLPDMRSHVDTQYMLDRASGRGEFREWVQTPKNELLSQMFPGVCLTEDAVKLAISHVQG